MARIQWDQPTEKLYETGVDRGVLFVKKDDGTYDKGVGWNGLTAVTDSPSGAEETALYANNRKYLGLFSAEEYGCTIECYTYPDAWNECDGSIDLIPGVRAGQQTHRGFGFTYRTLIGNDAQGDKYGYKIHIVYNCTASPSEKSYATVNDSPEAITFSYEVATTTVDIQTLVDGKKAKPSATIVIDSTMLTKTQLDAIEDKLYGTANSDPTLLSPDEIVALLGPSGATGATGATAQG